MSVYYEASQLSSRSELRARTHQGDIRQACQKHPGVSSQVFLQSH